MEFEYKSRPYADFLSLIVGYELDEIDALIDHVEEHRAAREARLVALQREVESDDDRYVDEFHQVMRVGELTSELAIVALHRVVELHRGSILHLVFPEFGPRSLDRFDVLKALVLHTKKVDITSLAGAREVDELRVLNNAVKHQAEVTKELAQFPAWLGKTGEKLGDLRPTYVRLRPFVPTYLESFATTVAAGK